MPRLINITIPVFNEERRLPKSIRRLHAFITENILQPWEIVIANNGSTDETLKVARLLEKDHANVRVENLACKGRGGALKRVWTESKADILAYMDCDLSTELDCFKPLIAPLLCGSHDLAVGSRLLADSVTRRGFKRSFISVSYNRLLKAAFNIHFSDAQCGFKAITRAAFTELAPLVQDDRWFMDTELLIWAEKLGYRIHDLPVRWADDPDSKVKILPTIMADLSGLIRVKRNLGRRKCTAIV